MILNQIKRREQEKMELTIKQRIERLSELVSDAYDLNFSQKVISKFRYQLHLAHIEYKGEKERKANFYKQIR